jgi:hypothetical protein
MFTTAGPLGAAASLSPPHAAASAVAATSPAPRRLRRRPLFALSIIALFLTLVVVAGRSRKALPGDAARALLRPRPALRPLGAPLRLLPRARPCLRRAEARRAPCPCPPAPAPESGR